MLTNEPISTISLVFLVLAFTTILSTRLKLSPVLLEILIGIIIGPYVLKIISITPEIRFLKEIGLVVLLFLAGLDFEFKNFREKIMDAILIAIPPGIVGFGLIFLIRPLDWFKTIELLVMALILTTTSISLSVSVLKEKMDEEENNYDTVVLAIIISNVAMVLIAGVMTESITATSINYLTILRNFAIVVGFILIVLLASQRLKFAWQSNLDLTTTQMQYVQTKFAFGLLGLILFISSFLGIELAVASFFAGIYVKETTNLQREQLTKFNVIGYGFLIPIFFVVMGMQINPAHLIGGGVLLQILTILSLSFVLQVSLTAVSSYIADFSIRESIIIGIGLSACSLSGGFAVLEIANKSGVLSAESYSILAAVITLSVLMTIIGLELFDRLYPEKHNYQKITTQVETTG